MLASLSSFVLELLNASRQRISVGWESIDLMISAWLFVKMFMVPDNVVDVVWMSLVAF